MFCGVFGPFKLKLENNCFPSEKVPGHQVNCFLVTLSINEKIILKFCHNNKISSHWSFGCFWSLYVQTGKGLFFSEEKVPGHQVIWIFVHFKLKRENNKVV